MKICIPTVDNHGLASEISPHFGRAPYYTMIDLDADTTISFHNRNQKHASGKCVSATELESEGVEAVICLGIGRNASATLKQMGIDVFVSHEKAVSKTLLLFKADQLDEVDSKDYCNGNHAGSSAACQHN